MIGEFDYETNFPLKLLIKTYKFKIFVKLLQIIYQLISNSQSSVN